MKKIILRIISVISCLAVIISVATIPSLAVEYIPGPNYGENYAGPIHNAVRGVEYYNAESLIKTEKKAKEFIITARVNSEEKNFYITFPSVGGFRLKDETSGFFEPKSLAKILYSYDTQGNLIMDTADGSTLRFIVKKNDWLIEVYNSNEKCLFTLTGEQLAYGIRNDSVKQVVFEMPLATGEVIYGGGERFSGLNLVGTALNMWNVDANYSTENSSTQYENTYKCIPVFHSNRGYMLFFNSTYAGTADIGKTNSKKYTLTFDGPIFDFYLWTGTPAESLQKYTSITGNTIVLPKWALGYWAGAGYMTWSIDGVEGTQYPRLQEVMANYEKIGTKYISAMYGEGAPSKDPMCYNLLRKTDTKMLYWNLPFAYESEINTWIPGVEREDYPIIGYTYDNQLSYSNWLDFTHPNIKNLIEGKYVDLWSYGLKGIMCDYGEYIPEHATFYNGKTGAEMHNLYTWYYNKVMSEIWNEQWDGDCVLFSRSACAGSQAFVANFSGDQRSTFRGLKNQLYGILNLSSCGFSLWGGDIGGVQGIPTTSLYCRWLQFGTFSPLMRTHNFDQGNDPWNFGDIAVDSFQQHYWLRENLIDDIYSHMISSSLSGISMVQAMPVAFPNNKNLANIEDQYLFCDNFLVSPVLEENCYYRKVSLPSGSWYNLWSYERAAGEIMVNAEAPIDQSPVYIRNGSVIAVSLSDKLELCDSFQDEDEYNGLLVTPPDNTRKTNVYDDEETKTEYISQKLTDSTFSITANGGSDKNAILVYGVTAAGVEVDGKKLQHFTDSPDPLNGVSGYYVDRKGRTVLYLAEPWNTITVTKGKSVYKPLVLTTDIRALNAVLDNDVTTSYIVNSAQSIEFALEDPKYIDELSLKWTYNYCNKFDVEVSEDGIIWNTVYTHENGLGGIDNIKFEKVKAKYIRISNFELPENMMSASLYEVAAYEYTDSNYNYGILEDDWNYEEESNEWLDDDNFDYESEDSNTKKKILRKYFVRDGEGSWGLWIWIAIVAAALILISTVIVIVVFKRKRKRVKET